jgi:hypothetical protein
MRGLKTDVGARTVITGHAFIQSIRRGHYELAVDSPPKLRVAAAFDELAQECDPDQQSDSTGLRSNNATKPRGSSACGAIPPSPGLA